VNIAKSAGNRIKLAGRPANFAGRIAGFAGCIAKISGHTVVLHEYGVHITGNNLY
jgi:hypothetical protein